MNNIDENLTVRLVKPESRVVDVKSGEARVVFYKYTSFAAM